MDTWQNLLIQGDCVNAYSFLEETLNEKIRLIYIDPPFFSGTNYTFKKRRKRKETSAPTLTETETYSDKWSGGLSEYLEFMRERVAPMKALLRNDGSLWVHLDWHVSHHMKVLLDDIFGYENFVNEIVWKRTNSPKAQSKGFGSQHDVILLYANDALNFETKPVYRKHDHRALKPYSYKDEKGKFRLIEIEAQGIQRSEGRKQFEWRGRTAPYLYRREILDEWWERVLIYTSKNNRYSKKQYLSESPGLLVSDLWFDISPIQGSSKEYTGFLTQKPKALLRRVIESATEPNDIVADFFVGSGTTAVIAAETSRRWIACDFSEVAIELTKRRLNENLENMSTKDSDYQYISIK